MTGQEKDAADLKEQPDTPFLTLVKLFWPTVPKKWLFFTGLFLSLLNGAVTPIFGFLLAQLVVAVTTGNQDAGTVNKYAVIVLLLAIANGATGGLKYYCLEITGMHWMRNLRRIAFQLILKQDKAWFDISRNAPSLLVQILIKDSEDSRQWVSTIFGQLLVVTAMLGLGLIWALIRGWQLTLVGFAIAPVFGIATAIQTSMVAKFEHRNKRCREQVNKKYYDSVANVRAIRSMGLESVFKEDFEKSLEKAHGNGVNGAFVDGLGYGVANGLIYLAQCKSRSRRYSRLYTDHLVLTALLFYVGAVLIANGTYSYLQMIEVLNLVVFSVTIAGQLLSFGTSQQVLLVAFHVLIQFSLVQRIGKALQSSRDFERLISLSSDTTEAQGSAKFPIQGEIGFHDVGFAYPSRPDAEILKKLSFYIQPNECVAVVGASGCGKSTVAALLQRLYEPTSGMITIGGQLLGDADTHWLRDHVAVVSQQPHLFDASVEQNIGYGAEGIDREDIEQAAREANVHDFIMSLPQGYDTPLGENASLISGGQAQRIQIARALVRSAASRTKNEHRSSSMGGSILILDECTSALDGANQKAVMNTIAKVKKGRTTIVVTHKLPVMQMADRIMVIEDGVVAEAGAYEELMKHKGTFWKLASAGEWEGE